MTASSAAIEIRNWARRLVRSNPAVQPLELVGFVARQVEQSLNQSSTGPGSPALGSPALGCSVVDLDEATAGLGSDPELFEAVDPPGGWSSPWLVGAVHEQAVSVEERQSRGAWYTPRPVVEGLVALATADGEPPEFAVDPTCGGGAFLLAVLDRLVELGIEPSVALSRVAGLDLDPVAGQVSRWSALLWAIGHGLDPQSVVIDVRIGDALIGYPDHWPAKRLVIGNPPFASPLRSGAVPPSAQAFRETNKELLGPYADLAANHLLQAVESCGPGSTVVLVQPQSILSARDTDGLRTHLNEVAPVYAMWAARESIFDAGVRAFAAVLKPGSPPPAKVILASGPLVELCSQVGSTSWAGHAARALGAPTLPAEMGSGPTAEEAESRHGTLGQLVTATAGFRDEYYGLVEACHEWSDAVVAAPNQLLTVGSVEPLASGWGSVACRFGGTRWLQPTIDLAALDAKVGSWTERQLRPKVVVATQSKLLEPVVDRMGTMVPATPLLAVHADSEDLWRVAAVFLAPPVVAWAWERWFGSALSVDALKLAARQVMELPLPPDGARWDQAAELIRAAHQRPDVIDSRTGLLSIADGWDVSCEVAAIMNRAYGAAPDVLEWWLARGKKRAG